MLFDELGEANVFAVRPATVHLPELDRLRQQSVFAANAFPPSDATVLSMPALIDGRIVTGARPTASRELMLTYQGSTAPVPWSKEPNLFSAIRAVGFNAALLGVWHPYCQLLGNGLSTCSQHDESEDNTLSDGMKRHLWDMLGVARFYEMPEKHFALYRKMVAEARELVRRQDVGLLFIHWPVPHYPAIYDRRTGQFSRTGDYLDNLELVDRALGDVRRAMEQSGTWENSNIVVTADHWWRFVQRNDPRDPPMAEEVAAFGDGKDHRVVFLLKMAGQKEGVTIQESFNTVLLHDLILEMLAQRVTTPAQAVAWIHAQPSAGKGELP